MRQLSLSATRSGDSVHVSAETSAMTGMAPTASTEVAGAANVNAGTITSSPGPISSARSASSIAIVPLPVATTCPLLMRSARASSNFSTQGPVPEIQPCSMAAETFSCSA